MLNVAGIDSEKAFHYNITKQKQNERKISYSTYWHALFA